MKFKNFHLTQKLLYSLSIFGVILGLPMTAHANVAEDFIALLAQIIWSIFVWPMTWLLRLELELLKIVASYNNFTSEGGVVIGWIALRDLSNMFFILILLVIAFATILRISSYGYQQLLKRTIIIAILINFSKSIVGFLIDIVQVIMLTFIAAVDNVITGGVVVALGLQKLFTLEKITDATPLYDYIIGLIMAVVFILILIVVIGVMVMMLTMRIVALWVVIVLSPLAFVASIFPATKSFYSKWVKELGSNLVSGPMLAFFLWLTFTIVGNGTAYNSFMTGEGTEGPTEFLGTSNMVNYIVAIALLLAGIKQAAASGAAGANFAAKGSSMIQSGASKFARRYPKAFAMRVGSRMAGGLIDKDKGGAARSLQQGFRNIAASKLGQRLNLTDKATKLQESKFGQSAVGQKLGSAAQNFQWNKIPFYGGRAQRLAMKVQGKHAAMTEEFKAEDEKYINPKYRQEFWASQSALKGGPSLGSVAGAIGRGTLKAGSFVVPDLVQKKVGEAAGKIGTTIAATSVGGKVISGAKTAGQFVSDVTPDAVKNIKDAGIGDVYAGGVSLLGNKDADFNRLQTMFQRRLIQTRGEANEAIAQFERMGWQEGIDGIHKEWPHTYTNKADAEKDVNDKGAKDTIKTIKEQSPLDEKGNLASGMRILFQAMIDDKDSLGIDMGMAMKGRDKAARQALTTGFSQFVEEMIDRLRDPNAEKGEYRFDDAKVLALGGGRGVMDSKYNEDTQKWEAHGNEKGVLQVDGKNPLIKSLDTLMQTYPQQAVPIFNMLMEHMERATAAGDYNFDDDSRSEEYNPPHLGETPEHYKARMARMNASWDENNRAHKAGEINDDQMYATRRQLMGVYTNKEIATHEEELRERIADPANATIAEGDVQSEAEWLKEELEALHKSPLRAISKNDEAGQIEAVRRMKMLTEEPVKEIAKVDSVTDREIEERAKKKFAEQSAGPTIMGADGKPIKSVSDEERMEQLRTEAREELGEEKIKEKDKKQGELDKKYDDDMAKFDEAMAKFADDMKKKMAIINNDDDAHRIDEVKVEIDEARDKGDTAKLAKLLTEQNTLIRLQSIKRKEALGVDTPNNNDRFSRALLKGSVDGMDYSRLQEMDIANSGQRDLFVKLAKVANLDQEKQMVMDANPNQIKLFATTLADTGRKPGKVVTDNISAAVQEEVYTKLFIQKFLKQGKTEAEARGWIAGTHPNSTYGYKAMSKKNLKDETT